MKKMTAGLTLAVFLPITQIIAVSSTAAQPPRSRVLAVGAHYRGVPFRWAGSSPRTGFDCSGFTRYVFARLHIRIPRTAEGQYRAFRHTRHPKPGDLFFVHNARGHVFHVGIYVGRHTWLEAERPGRGVDYYRPWSRNVSYGYLPPR